MGDVATLQYALAELRDVVAGLGDADMATVSNCGPWTVRQLASHALNNQLLWAGLVTGNDLVSAEATMGAVPHDGDLTAFADDATRQALALWSTPGVLDAIHATPMGNLPGVVVIDFAIIDAVAHAWDLSTSTGHGIDFAPEHLPAITVVVEATCTDAARDHGLIKPVTSTPADATATERLMSAAGRAIPRS
jgi:uncharacterized protein (TIGR03086 family)